MGLLTGFSIISGVEIVYFGIKIILKIIRDRCNKKPKTKSQKQTQITKFLKKKTETNEAHCLEMKKILYSSSFYAISTLYVYVMYVLKKTFCTTL